MALPSRCSTTLSNPIGVRLVLLGLVVMPVAVLVLPFNVDGHTIHSEYGLYWRVLFQVPDATTLSVGVACR